jgi:outer membrane protein
MRRINNENVNRNPLRHKRNWVLLAGSALASVAGSTPGAAQQVAPQQPDLQQSNAITSEIIPPRDRVEFKPVPYDGPALPSEERTKDTLADARVRGEGAPVLPLAEAIVRVLQNNPQRAAARAGLEAALARVGTAKSAGGLQVDLGLNANYNRAFRFPSTTTVSTGTGSGGTNSGGTDNSGNNGSGDVTNGETGGGVITNGNFGTISGGGLGNSGVSSFGIVGFSQSLSLNAQLPVYTGGRVKSARRVAQANARSQAAITLQTEQDLVTNAATTYLEVLRREQLLAVAENNLSVSRERRRVAVVRFEGGAVARVDVLSADSNFNDALQRRIQAVSDLAQSKANLNILMAREPETPFQVVAGADFAPGVAFGQTSGGEAGSTPGAAIPELPPIAASSGEELRALAENQRPALASSREQVEAAEGNVGVAKSQKKPQLGLDLGALIRNPITAAGRFALSLVGSLAQNLFDSGRARSEIREARALVEQSKQNLQSQRLQVANQIEQALLNLDTAQNRQLITAAAAVTAEGALRATQTGYAAGTLTQVDVSDAQSVLLQAQTDAVNARFNVAAARVNLAAAVGVLAPETQTAYNGVLAEELRKVSQKK